MQYLTDQSRRERMAGTQQQSGTVGITASYDKEKMEATINITPVTGAKMLGYEISRELNGKTEAVAFLSARSGETSWNDPLGSVNNKPVTYSVKAAELAAGADLMYHEATYAAAERKTARQRGHSTTEDAAKAALRAGAGRLIIGHYSSRYKDEQVLVDEARELFPETYPAVEGSTFTIEKRRPDSGADKNR